MRFLIAAMISLCFSSFAIAETTKTLQPVTDLSEFSRDTHVNQIEWNNQRPEQQRALNQFYQSISQADNNPSSAQREQQVQQMRSMNPQQRQQMFLNYIQQNR
ncbi:hypothetical protein A9R00_07670 [Oleispira antarctica]|uniref:DUF3106 domain-containing protein n=1 Tax=Oleispira antarctica TaxID=188908 RepID=A0A1Y5HW71_OLEAN|nr:hypothetical protein A9R00_07670 [Oleispira antarctica]